MNYKNFNIVITGGANGIGKVVAIGLAKLGSKIFILDHDENKGVEISKTQNIHFIKCNLLDLENISSAFEAIKEQTKEINILINNAGILHSEPLVNLFSSKGIHSIENWNKTINLNLTAPFFLSSLAAHHMIKNRTKGIIINMSSISAQGNAGQSAYSASKAGLESMTKVWSKELGSFGIRSVAVAPGFLEISSTNSAVSKSVIDHVKKNTPLKRLGSAENIFHTIKFIIENDFINGTVISVDGGLKI